jgi:hypothetical protein
MNAIRKKQKAALGPDDYYKAELIFNVEREPEVTMSVRITESLRDELRAFCKEHNIPQQKFIVEAVKEVFSRVKSELAATDPLEDARGVAQKEAQGES